VSYWGPDESRMCHWTHPVYRVTFDYLARICNYASRVLAAYQPALRYEILIRTHIRARVSGKSQQRCSTLSTSPWRKDSLHRRLTSFAHRCPVDAKFASFRFRAAPSRLSSCSASMLGLVVSASVLMPTRHSRQIATNRSGADSGTSPTWFPA